MRIGLNIVRPLGGHLSMEFAGRPIAAADLPGLIQALRLRRREINHLQKQVIQKRQPLTNAQRQHIFRKTNGRCHICGGEITGTWHADHVFPHSAGGAHSADNYIPAHNLCNNYRWDFTPDEFQLILRLGVWVKTQILHETQIGRLAAERFVAHERSLTRRRRPKISRLGPKV